MVGMEAAAVLKAAVSVTLNLVCNKLAPLVINEYSSIVGVKEDLRELQDLAQGINSRLQAAGDRALWDDPYLKKLKEVVYEVDDVVDEFQLKAEKHEADGDAGFVSKYLHTKPKSFIFQCQAAKKIKKIKKTFDVLEKQSTILNSVLGNDPVSHINNTAINKQALPFVDGAAVIGRDLEKHRLISMLLKTDDQQRTNIVSIVGLGGSGKTTLAQLVFNDVKTIGNHFTLRLWVHVSQEFHDEKILKKLFDAIPNEKSEGLSLTNMANKISDKLTNNRFLLVLDDVWIEDRNRWKDELMVHVKNGSPGSKILLTTRSRNVVEAVESTKLIDLPSLSEDYSWQLFQQSFGNAVKDLDSEFQEVGKEIVNKCGGVPLAIKVLAGVLRVKKRIEQWHAIKDNNLLDVVDGGEHQVSACLRLSYFNLPSHLKQCFTICSIFPKGHSMDKDQLIDKWIAHDMIPQGGVNYLEYITGNDYFNHLVQMCFIQDVEEAESGRVKCKMHDLVHDLARSIVGDEISLVMPMKTTNFTNICRYFSVMKHTRHLPPKNIFRKARAMYITGNDDFIFGKASKKAKHLRSITVEYVHKSALTAMLQTENLRYLNISGLQHETLPEVISDIWSLQALHVTHSRLVKLPDSIGNLKKLRVVNLSYCWDLTSLPESIGNCVMISSIDLFGCVQFATLPSSISKNERLRVLRLGYTKLERLPSSITELQNLECLDLRRCFKLVELPEGIGNLKKLVVLNLKECGNLRAIPKGIAQLTRLEKLGLFVMGTDENDAQISELENVNRITGQLDLHGIAHGMDPDAAHKEWLKQKTNLQSLILHCESSNVGVNTENQLEGLEPPSGIKRLKIVRYQGQECTQWMLKHVGSEVAGLPRFLLMRELELSDFPTLECLEGITELPYLEKLVLKGMNALKSISGGPFPSLLELSMDEMPSLGVVWMVTEGSLVYVEGGKVQIGDRLSALSISKCPKLILMPYFPLSIKDLRLVKSNMQLLGLPSVGHGSSLPSSSTRLPSFSFSHLKNLELEDMPPPAGAASYGCGYRWELLQHFTALESLKIQCLDGLTELPEIVRGLSSLRTLQIMVGQTLCVLPEWLGELCYLETMDILACGRLNLVPSMQPLRALKALSICYANGWVPQTPQVPDCTSLNISRLSQSFRQFISLTNLKIRYCHFDQLPECLGELRSLQILIIEQLHRLRSLPQSLGYLTSLQELRIDQCFELGHLPDCVGELRSLRVLVIWWLPWLTCLPQSLGRLTSLQRLEIGICEALGQLPESLGELCLPSLEKLNIRCCPRIRSLPDWIKGLTALQTLQIDDCPDLERRCRRREGKDWHLISHIPHLSIGGSVP